MMHYKYVEKEDMVDGDMVAGVCYAAAAEDLIKHRFPSPPTRPTVIGYLVKADSDEDEVVVARESIERAPIPTHEKPPRNDGECPHDDCRCWAPNHNEDMYEQW